MIAGINSYLAEAERRIWEDAAKVRPCTPHDPSPHYTRFKIIASALLLLGFIWTSNDGHNNFMSVFIYLTMWGYLFTFLFFVGSTITLFFRGVRINWNTLIFVYQVAFSLQLCITLMYWVALFPLIEVKTFYTVLLNLTIHFMPLVLLYVEMYLGDVVIRRESLLPVVLVSLAYFVVNLCYTLIKGPVYPIVTYKDLMSYVYLLGSCVLILGTFALGVLFTRKCKPHLLEYNESLLS